MQAIADGSAAVDNTAVQDPVPTKYWVIESLSIRLLQTRFNLLNKTYFSVGNLRKMQCSSSGNDQASKDVLLDILEFVTGVSRKFRLVGKHRDFAHVDLLLSKGFVVRKNRMNTLSLPPTFGTDGIYEVDRVVKGKFVEIRHRFLDNCVKRIPLAKVGQMLDLILVNNHSEIDAAVASKSDLERAELLSSYFKLEADAAYKGDVQQLMIVDGDAEDCTVATPATSKHAPLHLSPLGGSTSKAVDKTKLNSSKDSPTTRKRLNLKTEVAVAKRPKQTYDDTDDIPA